MMTLAARLATGILLSLAIASVAWRRRSLSTSGACAAVIVGTLIYLGGGPAWFSVLITFFITSTLVGRIGRQRKALIKREFEKGDTRDAMQALSNGGVAAACAIAMSITPHPLWSAAFLGALATANADTWATELGILSRAEPWSLTKLRRVPRGSSGAVSPLGLVVTLAGGFAVGLVATLDPEAFMLSRPMLLVLGTCAGFFGALLDSYLGATVQAGFHCPACARDSEGPRHFCGTTAVHARGALGIDNDRVNLLATLGGALLSGLAVYAFG